MAKSPLILAALAKSAVPELQVAQVSRLHGSDTGQYDSALIGAQDGSYFVVRIPETAAAALELDVEVQVLKALAPLKTKLPFKVTNLVGLTADEKKNRVAIFEYLFGSPVNLQKLSAGSQLAQSIAESIAAIHRIDTKLISNAGLPEFDSATVLRRRLNELDAIAMTGKASKSLLDRWQDALEDVNLFKFQPRVVHGELSEDTVLAQDNRVSGILNWGGLHVGDPAEDFFWLAGRYDQELMDAIRLSYSQAQGATDAHLVERAQLYFEMECGRWLLHTIKTGRQDLISDAENLLSELTERLESLQLPNLRPVSISSVAASESSFVAASEASLVATTQISIIDEVETQTWSEPNVEANSTEPNEESKDLF